MRTSSVRNELVFVVIHCGLCWTLVNAQSGFEPISSPDAAYLGATTKMPVTVPDHTVLQGLSDNSIVMSFLDLPNPPIPTTVSAQTWAWSSPPFSEESMPRCLFYPYTEENAGSILISFSKPLQTFGLEVELQDPNLTKEVTVSFFKGSFKVGWVTRTLGGVENARLFAAHSGTAFFDWVQVSSPSSAPGYAMAQLRYALSPPPPPQPGPGAALEFSGGYVAVPPFTPGDGNALTIEAWMRPYYIGPWAHTVMRQIGAGSPDWLLEFQGGTVLAFGLKTQTGYQELKVPITVSEYSGAAWYHIAVVYDGLTQRLYRNGVLLGTTNLSGRLTFTGAVSAIGAAVPPAGAYTSMFAGDLDELRIWHVARTAAEINQTLHRSLAGSEPGLAAYWRFDEGYGSRAAYDSSGHGRTGTLQSGPPELVWIASSALLGQPLVQTTSATVTTNSANLNGRVSLFGLGAATWFEWGYGTGNATNRTPTQSFGDLNLTNVVTQLLTNLPSSSFFSYRCVASNSAGVARGALVSFVTVGPPAVNTLPPTSLVSTSVVLQGSVNPFGFATTTGFEWGTNTSYGNRSASQNASNGFASISISETLTNLVVGQRYDYRLVATNALGLFFGTNQTFTVPLFSRIFAPYGTLSQGAVAWGDYDRDGDLDLVVTGTMITNGVSGVFRWDETNFTSVWGPGYSDFGFPRVNSGSAIWSDLNNEGGLGLLLTGDDTTYWGSLNGQMSRIWRYAGGSFTNLTELTGVGRSAAAVGDYDSDGYPDILMTGRQVPSYDVSIPTNILYHNDGNGAFTDAHAGLPAVFDSAVAWGDYDNDGKLDLLLAGDTGSGLIARVYHNQSGGFTDSGAVLPGVAFGSVTWGDYDGDGWLDILLAGSTNGLASGAVCKIYRSHHDGTFTEVGVNLPSVYRGTAAWGDYDNDGQLDLLTTGEAPARLYRNDHGVFAELPAGLPASGSVAAAWGDYDGDGLLDLALNRSLETYDGWREGTFNVFRNYAPNTNRPPDLPTAPTGLTTAVLNTGVTLRWAAGTDPHTPTPGLTYNVRVGTAPGGGQIIPPQSDLITGQRRLPQMGNAEHRLFSMLTNLPVGLYYWSVQTVNHSFVGSLWAAEQTFAITSGPPVVATLPASNLLCCSALLNGTVTPGGLTTRAWFEWGTTTNFGNSTPPLDLGTGLIPQSVPHALSGLQPLTTYFFRLVATNTAGLALGTNQSITTAGPAPIVATLTSSNVSFTSAALLGTSPLSSPPADYFIEWGITPAYGQLASAAVLDSALHFDGVDDCVAVGWGRVPGVTNNFTIELWVNPAVGRAVTVESVAGTAGAGGQRFAIFPEQGSVAYGGGHAGVGLSVGTNGVSVMEHTGGYLPTVLVYSNGVSGWTHLALVYSNHVPLLFVNAALARTGLISGQVAHPSSGLGGVTDPPWNQFGPFAGAIQEVRIWDVPLDAPTIQAWMNQPVTPDHPAYSRLQGYWPLSEGRGTNAFDESPHNYTGQLLKGTGWTGGRQSSARVFRIALNGLSPGTTHHFRAVAINPGGTAYGADQTFTTLPRPRVLDVALQTAPASAGSLLRFSGSPGSGYVMEASTNLVDWLALTNLVAGSDGRFEFLDPGATNLPTRFYRLRVP